MKKKICGFFGTLLLFTMLFAMTALAGEANKITISYNGNGATSGAMTDSVYAADSQEALLTTNTYTRSGYAFAGWNTAAAGNGTSYINMADVAELTQGLTEDTTITLYAQWKAYVTTIVFKSNGGKGSMTNQTVLAGKSGKLYSNKFKRSGFVFAGWNTTKNGKGKSYVNKAKLSGIVSATANKKVILYAQWILKAPKISSVTQKDGVTVTVKYSTNKKAAGYELQISSSKKFTKKTTTTVTTKKGKKQADLTVKKTGAKAYIRVRNYWKNGSTKMYSAWSSVKTKTIPKASTIDNVKSDYAIEADVTLTGSGSGYHAKLVMCTALSAVSWGIQYDTGASIGYGSKAMALLENVANNGSGGQTYTRFAQLSLNKSFHLMMTLNKNGSGELYVDYKKVGSFSNPNLANQYIYFRVEGAARQNGDSVNAVFKNIKVRKSKKGEAISEVTGYDWLHHGIKIKDNGKDTVTCYGTLNGAGGDWDQDFEGCSSVRQFF